MQNTTKYIGILVLIALVALGAYVATRSDSNNALPSESVSEEVDTSEPQVTSEEESREEPTTRVADGEVVTLRGTVTDVDLEALARDGDGFVAISADDGSSYTIRLIGGDLPRQAEVDTNISVGDTVSVRGEVRGGDIVPFNAGEYLRVEN